MFVFRKTAAAVAAAACLAGLATVPAAEAQTIKAVMHSDVKILDPIWTTAYIVRNHGYMVYDTLFALDDKLVVQPQMVDRWTLSDDKLVYAFTLREGLKFHDGKPMTAKDVQCTWNMLMGKSEQKFRLNFREAWYKNLDEVTVNGDREVTFRLKSPQPAFMTLLASGFSPGRICPPLLPPAPWMWLSRPQRSPLTRCC